MSFDNSDPSSIETQTFSHVSLGSPPPSMPKAKKILNRLTIVVAVSIVCLLVAVTTSPSVVANNILSSYPPVVANISGISNGQIVHEYQPIKFSAANSRGYDLSYVWTFPDGTTAIGKIVTTSFQSYIPNARVQLTVSDPLATAQNFTHMNTVFVTFSILPNPPVPSFTATVGNFNTYNNSVPVNFDASASTGEQISTYQWDFGDGSTDVTYSPTDSHDYTQIGTYQVSLTVTDDANQTASISQEVVVSVPAPKASFTASALGSFYEIQVDASNSSGAITNYHWDFGDGNTDDTSYSTDSHYYNNPGTYVITLTVTDAFGRTSTTSQTVTVNS